MNDKSNPDHSHLFRMRLWIEDLGNGRSEWRGRVQHVLSGKEYYFRTWNELKQHMESALAETESRD